MEGAMKTKLRKSPEGLKAQKADDGNVYVEGFLSTPDVDAAGDVMHYDKVDMSRFDKNMAMFFNHNRDLPIGKWLEYKLSESGLWVKGVLLKAKTEFMEHIRSAVLEGALKTTSIGFDPLEEEKDLDGVNHILRWKLNEGSLVTLPCNENCLVTASQKGLKKRDLFKSQSYKQVKEWIMTEKGAHVAGRIHNAIWDLVWPEEGEPKDRHALEHQIVMRVAESTGKPESQILDVFHGDSIPEDDVVRGFAEALELNADELVSLNNADRAKLGQTEPAPEPTEPPAAPENEEASKPDSENPSAPPKAPMPTMEGEEDNEDDKGDMPKEPKPDDEEPKNKEEEPEDGEQAKAPNAVQQCVESKIPALLEEGKTQEEAVAIALEMCNAEGKCSVGSLTTKDLDWLSNLSKQEPPDQSTTGSVSDLDNPTDFGSPYLDLAKTQTALLGELVNKVNALTETMNNVVNAMNTQTVANEPISTQNPDDGKGYDDPENEDDEADGMEMDLQKAAGIRDRLKASWESLN
jgi:HK97 family phage prohead protease